MMNAPLLLMLLPTPHQPKITSSDLSSKYIDPACASEINVSNYNPHLQR